jgi:hypothetical protein
MDFVNFPPRSDEKIDPSRGFPQNIVYRKLESGNVITRTYMACGCFARISIDLTALNFKCTAHGGDETCFWPWDQELRKLMTTIEVTEHQLEASRAAVLEETERLGRLKQRVRMIERRDSSPERK